jgi:hypothetical protein
MREPTDKGLPVVPAKAEPAEVVGGRWDGLIVQVLPAGIETMQVDSRELDDQAKHPAMSPSRMVILRRIGNKPARYSETSSLTA